MIIHHYDILHLKNNTLFLWCPSKIVRWQKIAPAPSLSQSTVSDKVTELPRALQYFITSGVFIIVQNVFTENNAFNVTELTLFLEQSKVTLNSF